MALLELPVTQAIAVFPVILVTVALMVAQELPVTRAIAVVASQATLVTVVLEYLVIAATVASMVVMARPAIQAIAGLMAPQAHRATLATAVQASLDTVATLASVPPATLAIPVSVHQDIRDTAAFQVILVIAAFQVIQGTVEFLATVGGQAYSPEVEWSLIRAEQRTTSCGERPLPAPLQTSVDTVSVAQVRRSTLV
jgi:hypothetical protein